jgi:hypothetical protein
VTASSIVAASVGRGEDVAQPVGERLGLAGYPVLAA